MTETEIGNGVTATFNGWHIKLRCWSDAREHVIYLTPTATEALADYIAELRRQSDDFDDCV
jgi:hypothetical protein